MKKRIALAGIYHESNTFLPNKTTWKNFEQGHLFRGDDIRKEYEDAFHEIGGIIEVFEGSEVEIVPVFFAEATPGGMIPRETYERLISELLTELKATGPWDGAMLCAHGAAVAEGYADMDGDWLGKVRQLLGAHVPMVCTIDPHANVSDKMTTATDAMIAYATNPHLDQRETGKKAARLMLSQLSGRVQLSQSFYPTQVSISIEQQATSEYPCTLLYENAAAWLNDPKVLSVSVVLGFPYADVKEMGSSFIVVTDNDPEYGKKVGRDLRDVLERNRHDFIGERICPEEAIEMSVDMPSPVLLLDMGDNVGGGSPGDSTALLHAIQSGPEVRYFVCLYDPVAVSMCELKGRNTTITLVAGGRMDPRSGEPFSVTGKIKKLGDGVFRESEVRHGGQINYNMGRIAILETGNGSVLMLTSRRIPPFSLSQLTTFGVDPGKFDVIIAKGVQAPVAAYAPVCPSMIRVNTPGLTCADATQLEYQHRRMPMFPFEDWQENANRS